jgi:transcriptional regulator with XRE-family HTH domain
MADVMVSESPGDAIERLLEGRPLTWLARRTGIAYKRVWRIRINEKAPTAEEAKSLAGAFGVPVETFLTAEGAN